MPQVSEQVADHLSNLIVAVREVDKSLTFIGYVLLMQFILSIFKK